MTHDSTLSGQNRFVFFNYYIHVFSVWRVVCAMVHVEVRGYLFNNLVFNNI